MENLDRIEIEFAVERPLDIGGLAKTMLLAREQKEADRHLPAAQGVDHLGSLVWRHDPVLAALEEYHRARQALGMEERRAGAVDGLHRRIWADEPIEIARFELVRVLGVRCEIADAVVARPACEDIAERQRSERRESAGAAAGDDRARPIDQTLPGEEFDAAHRIVDVDDAPVEVETIAVGAAESG